MAQNKALYTFGKCILFPAYKLLYRFKVKNKGAVPAEGGVILTSNHLSFADPVLLGLCEKRRLYFMAKSELFSNKFAGAVIRALGAFPVERGAGDGKAIKTGEDILAEAASNAAAVVALGSCAVNGGWMAAYPNSANATGVSDFLKKRGIATPVVNIPGCPANPEWLMSVLVQVLMMGGKEALVAGDVPAVVSTLGLNAEGKPEGIFGQFTCYNLKTIVSALA